MAAIDSVHSSHPLSLATTTMTTRRVPLAQVPNATNSPLRHAGLSANVGPPKRSRAQLADGKDAVFGLPPAKKQIIEVADAEARRSALPRRAHASQPTELQRRFEAVRDAKAPAKTEVARPPVDGNLEHIRTWQRHYRRAFPQYTFYFDNVPDDVKPKISRQLRVLGAREEKFFSKSITHVVTTRPIPSEYKSSSSAIGRAPSSVHGKDPNPADGQPQTINPSLLERTQGDKSQKGKFNFDAPMTRAAHASTQSLFQDVERKQYGHSADILHKAKEMGMKLWALEKLQRMMTTMFDTDTGEQPKLPTYERPGRNADLELLLQKEKITGPANVSLASQDMVSFNGFYIYVHDQDEKTKPILMRDYQKPSDDGVGTWPQLYASSAGRCPFVEDPDRHSRRHERETRGSPRRKAASLATTAKTRAAAPRAREERSRSRVTEPERQPLAENHNTNVGRFDSTTTVPTDKTTVDMGPPKKGDGTAPLFGSAQARMRAAPRIVGGEPVASGIQPSHITSAIRSQMISSTAATGARAGTSREVHQLQRKVLERNSVASGSGSVPSSYLNDVRAAINTGQRAIPQRAAKLKAQETLGHIHEDMTPDEALEKLRKAEIRKRKTEKEAKPGYCENCREKFNDFDQHIVSRKHRKFASTTENWTELDDLLAQFERPFGAEMMVCE